MLLTSLSKLGRLLGQYENCSLRLGPLYIAKNFESSSQDSTEDHQYDVHQYQVPLLQDQKQHILKVLNAATEEELLSYKLPKGNAQKLLAVRKKKKQFEDIKDLIFVEGIGLKKIELICHHILHGEAPAKVKPKSVKRITMGVIQPKIPDYLNVTSVVGVAVINSRVSWCELQKFKIFQPSDDLNTELHSSMSSGETATVSRMRDQTWRVCQLDSKKILDFKTDSLGIFTGVQASVDAMPSNAVYIMPERQKASSRDQSPLAFSVAHTYGLLAVLLNKKALKEAPPTNLEERTYADDPSPKAVYFAKEPQLYRSLQMQQDAQLIYGVRVLHAVLERSGTTPMQAVCGSDSGSLEVPSVVAERFNARHASDRAGQAVAFCMALAFPGAYFR
ncbi:RuvA domain 2-like [Trinorchestia longiramus]|nr:RuvA domain 2-like [Trinorchestia longiramus]